MQIRVRAGHAGRMLVVMQSLMSTTSGGQPLQSAMTSGC